MHLVKVPKKWRPSLGLLIAVVAGVLVLLPIAALMGARVTSNQFVRETEANLHSQAAIYSAIYARAFAAIERNPDIGTPISDAARERTLKNFHPIDPNLVASSGAILPPRADPVASQTPVTGPHAAIRGPLARIAEDAQKTTLVGFHALDHTGQIIARTGKEAGNLSHVEEVARALSGEIASAARWRSEEYQNHSIRSISRDTKFRVFVAHPVIVSDRVVGAVYLSRTPSNLNKYLFQQRNTFAWLFAAVTLSAVLIGLFLWRFLTRPLSGLADQAADIAKGTTREKLQNYGVKEIASLGQSIMDMGTSLRKQSAALESYTKHATHELKSPVTSIMGAAELLEGDNVDDARREKLAAAIKTDAARMDQLLLRMREMARGRVAFDGNPATLSKAVSALAPDFPALKLTAIGQDTPLPISQDALEICLRHLFENAQEHDATEVTLDYAPDARVLSVTDNGSGLTDANARQAAKPFFTTKREQGGTGLGLAICAEIVDQFDGKITIENNDNGGATVRITFGAA